MPLSAPGQSTFDLTPPRRPGDDDLNGHSLEDDGEEPPGDPTLPSADLFNTESGLAVSYGAVVPNLIVAVNGGATPSFGLFTSTVRTVRENTAATTLTLTRASAGDVSITWAANTFPPPLAAPEAKITAVLGAHSYSIGCVAITNGVRVTTTVDGVLTDVSFTVTLY